MFINRTPSDTSARHSGQLVARPVDVCVGELLDTMHKIRA